MGMPTILAIPPFATILGWSEQWSIVDDDSMADVLVKYLSKLIAFECLVRTGETFLASIRRHEPLTCSR